MHSSVIVAVTPGELAGHLALLEIGLSKDQYQYLCVPGRRRKKKCQSDKTNQFLPKEAVLLSVIDQTSYCFLTWQQGDDVIYQVW